MNTKFKRLITVGALFVALTLNLQFASNGYSLKGLSLGTPAYAQDDEEEPDETISGVVVKKYPVTISVKCYIWCSLNDGTPYSQDGWEDKCKRKVAEKEDCTKKACDAKCP